MRACQHFTEIELNIDESDACKDLESLTVSDDELIVALDQARTLRPMPSRDFVTFQTVFMSCRLLNVLQGYQTKGILTCDVMPRTINTIKCVATSYSPSDSMLLPSSLLKSISLFSKWQKPINFHVFLETARSDLILISSQNQ